MQGQAAEGRTMIVVTHEMAFAREVSTQVIFRHNGQIEEQDSLQTAFSGTKSERLQQFLSGALK